jgi:hypothetical protein
MSHDLQFTRVLNSLRHRLKQLGGDFRGEERSIRVKKAQLHVMKRGLATDPALTKSFVIGGGISVVLNMMLQRKFATDGMELLLLLSKSSRDLTLEVYRAGCIKACTSACQRCNSSDLHGAFLELICTLAVEAEVCRRGAGGEWSVPDALMTLLSTRCLVCKTTAMTCLSTLSLDAASARNLLGGSLSSSSSSSPSSTPRHWSAKMLPALFRLALDKSRPELQLQAGEALVLLASPAFGNSREVAKLLAILLGLEVYERSFIVSRLPRWAVKDKQHSSSSPAASSGHRTFHEHALTATFILTRLFENAKMGQSAARRQLREAGLNEMLLLLDCLYSAQVHVTALLFVLSIVQQTKVDCEILKRGAFESSECLREAQEARKAVLAVLQRWLFIDDRVRLSLYELLALHRVRVHEGDEGPLDLAATLGAPDFPSSLASEALAASLRIEFPIAANLASLVEAYLDVALEEEVKGFPPLLENSTETRGEARVRAAAAAALLPAAFSSPSHGVESKEGKAAAESRLGYKLLAKLFNLRSSQHQQHQQQHHQQIDSAPIVPDEMLEEALRTARGAGLPAASADKPGKRQTKERERPWALRPKRAKTWDEIKEEKALLERQRKREERELLRRLAEQQADSSSDNQQQQQQQQQQPPEAPPRASKKSPRGGFLRYVPVRPPFPNHPPLLSPEEESWHGPGSRFEMGGVSLDELKRLSETRSLAFLTEIHRRPR